MKFLILEFMKNVRNCKKKYIYILNLHFILFFHMIGQQ